MWKCEYCNQEYVNWVKKCVRCGRPKNEAILIPVAESTSQGGDLTSDESKNKFAYNPHVTAWIEKSVPFSTKQIPVNIPVPEDQRWLFSMLDRQINILSAIKSWLTFLVIFLIISMLLQLYFFVALSI